MAKSIKVFFSFLYLMENLDIDSASAGEIMTPHVIMLESNATFKDALDTLYKKSISAVFIKDPDKREYFILTQSAIIAFLANSKLINRNMNDLSVKEIWEGPITPIDINDTVDQIIWFMTSHNYKRVLVVEDEDPIGVISTRDIMKWNDTYFKPAKPQVLLIMDNGSGNFIARYIFEENIEDDIERNLMDLYGGAIQSVSFITDEIMSQSGPIVHLEKNNRSVLFEPYFEVTGVLICDYNSIKLRRLLIQATHKFYSIYEDFIKKGKNGSSICRTFDIKPVLSLFKDERMG